MGKDKIAPDVVVGQPIISEGIEHPWGRERQEYGGGVDDGVGVVLEVAEDVAYEDNVETTSTALVGDGDGELVAEKLGGSRFVKRETACRANPGEYNIVMGEALVSIEAEEKEKTAGDAVTVGV